MDPYFAVRCFAQALAAHSRMYLCYISYLHLCLNKMRNTEGFPCLFEDLDCVSGLRLPATAVLAAHGGLVSVGDGPWRALNGWWPAEGSVVASGCVRTVLAARGGLLSVGGLFEDFGSVGGPWRAFSCVGFLCRVCFFAVADVAFASCSGGLK